MRDDHQLLSDDSEKELNHRFLSGPDGLTGDLGALEGGARSMAEVIMRNAPASRERALALTDLEQALFWAKAAVTRAALAPQLPLIVD